MAPTPQAAQLETALAEATHEIFRTDRDNMTVNAVRKRVEDRFDLEDGFFKADAWKGKSKQIITSTADKLLDAEGDSEEQAPAAAKPKPEKKEDKTGRPIQTQTHKPQKAKKLAPESDQSDDAEALKKKPASKKRKLGKRTAIESSDEDDGPASDVSPSDDARDKEEEDDYEEEESSRKRKKAKAGAKPAPPSASGASSPLSDVPSKSREILEDDDDSEVSEMFDEPPSKRKKKQEKMKEKSKPKKQQVVPRRKSKSADAAGDDSDSSLSSVIDDAPPQRKKKGQASSGSGKPSSAAAAAISPDEAEVKKLQGQLVKCGVRKIWGIELKKYGDDAKAKIRHLKGMLRDIGMDGRFSEARAREIKERRELEADLEAVQEMDRNWGVGGRASRSRKVQSFKEASSADEAEIEGEKNGDENKTHTRGGDANEDNGDDDDDDNGPTVHAKSRSSSRFGDLAFLGSDDEDTSD